MITESLDVEYTRYLAEETRRKALSPNVRRLAADTLSLIAEAERLQGALDQVRALHVSDDGDGTPCCAEDGFIWPCTTARIASLYADYTDTKEQDSE